MIDWIGVGTGALWIVGLSIALATISFAYAVAAPRQVSLRQVLQRGPFSFFIHLGLVLFCLGMAGSTAPAWESVLWLVLAILFGVQARQTTRTTNRKSQTK